MKIIIHSDGLPMTPTLKAAADEKFGRVRRLLERFDHSDLVMDVLLSRTTTHHHKGKIFRCECRLTLGKKALFAAVEGDELYEAMDHTIAALKKQCVKLKEQQE